ncbi:DUF2156 domain-containing protein [Candidatus Woesearchaeota archaeon]|nr:DUF2156 domain-containing protein [Candidatus Woesearchaeota archaeon]
MPTIMQFRPITLDDKSLFDKYLGNFPQNASELTFTNLFAWRKAKKHEFTEIDSHLLVKTGSFYYQPIGASPSKIIRKIIDKESKAVFERVEKKIAQQLEGLKTKEQRGMFDYVYRISDLTELKGNKFEPKRNLIKQCEKYQPEVCMLNEGNIHEFFQLQKKWCSLKSCEENKPLQHENEAITETLNNFREFKLLGICIRKEDAVAGFAIGEQLNNNVFVEHFEKGDTMFKGIYQYVLKEFVKAIPSHFKYLNREQDLGIPGIRKAKESYYPVKLVEKYRVSSE